MNSRSFFIFLLLPIFNVINLFYVILFVFRLSFLIEDTESYHQLTLPTAKAGGFLLQSLQHRLISYDIAMSYTVSTS